MHRQQVARRLVPIRLRPYVLALALVLALLALAAGAMAQETEEAGPNVLRVSPIAAFFDPPAQTTTYSVVLADAE